MTNIFGTKYPIVCAPMFEMSNANLAVAVHNAGCFPSFVLSKEIGFDYKFAEIKKFIDITHSQNFTILTDIFTVTEENYNNRLLIHNPKFIDIGTLGKGFVDDILDHPKVKYLLDYCRDNLVRLTLRTSKIVYNDLEHFDIINIKGSESAGLSGNKSIREMFLEQKRVTPNKIICPSGGIATGEDIDWFLENGAGAVSIGSAFSLTKESRLSPELKNKILSLSSKNLEKLDNGRYAVIVGNTNFDIDDANKSQSLIYGISNKGGHVYMGKAIDKVNELLSVQELVNNLVSNSKHLQCLV